MQACVKNGCMAGATCYANASWSEEDMVAKTIPGEPYGCVCSLYHGYEWEEQSGRCVWGTGSAVLFSVVIGPLIVAQLYWTCVLSMDLVKLARHQGAALLASFQMSCVFLLTNVLENAFNILYFLERALVSEFNSSDPDNGERSSSLYAARLGFFTCFTITAIFGVLSLARTWLDVAERASNDRQDKKIDTVRRVIRKLEIGSLIGVITGMVVYGYKMVFVIGVPILSLYLLVLKYAKTKLKDILQSGLSLQETFLNSSTEEDEVTKRIKLALHQIQRSYLGVTLMCAILIVTLISYLVLSFVLTEGDLTIFGQLDPTAISSLLLLVIISCVVVTASRYTHFLNQTALRRLINQGRKTVSPALRTSVTLTRIESGNNRVHPAPSTK